MTRLSFTARLTLTTLLISLTGLALITAIIYGAATRILDQQLAQDLRSELERESLSFSLRVDEIKSNARLLATSSEISGLINAQSLTDEFSLDLVMQEVRLERLQTFFTAVMQQHPTYYQIRYISFDNGDELVRIRRVNDEVVVVPEEERLSHRDSQGLTQARLLPPLSVRASNVHLIRHAGKVASPKRTAITVVASAPNQNGEPAGLVIIDADFETLLARADHSFNQRPFFVVDAHGHYLYHHDRERILDTSSTNSANLFSDFSLTRPVLSTLNFQLSPLLDSQQLALIGISLDDHSGGENRIFFALHSSKNLLASSTNALYWWLFLIIFVLMALAAVASIVFSRRISRPVLELTDAAQRIARGEQEVDMPLISDDEVGELNQSFQAMVAHLQSSQQELRTLADSLEDQVRLRTSELQLRNDAIESAPIGIIIATAEGKALYANRAFQQIFYITRPSDIFGLDLSQLWVDGEIEQSILRYLRRVQFWQGEFLAQRKDGSQFTAQCSVTLTTQDDGNQRLVAAIEDISARKRTELMLKKLSKAVEHSGSTIAITDTTGTIEYINPRFMEVTGYRADELIGQKMTLLQSKRTPKETYQQLWRTILSGATWHGELLNRKKNGELYWILEAISSIRDEEGAITHFVVAGEDITMAKQTQQQIERMAFFDPLTNLPNRTLFRDRLNQALRNIQRNKQSLALLYLDLDGFKTVNDSLGHDAGDELLKQIAERLESTLRGEDIVARLGGDEFTVILPDLQDTESAGKVADKLLAAISSPISIRGQQIYVGASIGITIAPADSTNSDTLLKFADMAMYRAKDNGKNHWQFFTPEMHSDTLEKLQLEQDLHKALQQGELTLHYQPIVDLHTHRIVALEGLARWNHPDRGYIRPDHFIRVAEENGLIFELGRKTLHLSHQFAHELHNQLPHPPIISVNLSAHQFYDRQTLALIESIACDPELQRGWLQLEITETLLIQDIQSSIHILESLRDLGVTIAIDDFGTGYSSLSYLQQLPIDRLKIDRSFVDGLPNNTANDKITQTIMSLGSKLELSLVAEGIEEPEQADYLAQLGCQYGQGFYFHRPMECGALLSLLQDEDRHHSPHPEHHS